MTTITTLRPTSTQQSGTGATIVPSGTVHGVLSDNTDTTYVQIAATCRVGAQPPRVSFPTPSLPAGSKVVSVRLRRRIQQVTDELQIPLCWHEFRCLGDLLPGLGGAVQTTVQSFRTTVVKTQCPVDDAGAWVEQTEWKSDRGPGDLPWSVAAGGNLTSFQYALGREDSYSTVLRISEVYLDVEYQQLNVVTISGPTGTITTTCRPTVFWSVASADSKPQEKWQVKVFSQAKHDAIGFDPTLTTPDQDSGVVLGEAGQWTLAADLTNGLWYAYVWTWSQFDGPGDFPTTVVSTSWTQNITGAPNANLSYTNDLANYRVGLTASPSSGSPTTTAYAFLKSSDSGNTWQPVRGGLLVAAAGMTPVTIYDNEPVPNPNRPMKYKVLAYGTVSSVLLPAAAASAIQNVTVTQNEWVLSDPLDPTAIVRLPVKPEGDAVTQRQIAGVFWPVGGDEDGEDVEPFVVKGPRFTPSGVLDMFWDDDTAWQTFQAMDQSRRTLYLRSPWGQGLYVAINVGPGAQDPTWKYDAIPGQPTQVYYRDMKMAYTSTRPVPVTS